VINGSFNFSNNATDNNDENVIIIDNLRSRRCTCKNLDASGVLPRIPSRRNSPASRFPNLLRQKKKGSSPLLFIQKLPRRACVSLFVLPVGSPGKGYQLDDDIRLLGFDRHGFECFCQRVDLFSQRQQTRLQIVPVDQ